MDTQSVVIADSQQLIRIGLNHILSEMEGMDVRAEVTDRNELFVKLIEHLPSLVIIDYDQTENFDIQDIKEIFQYCPKTRVLVITSDESKQNIFQVLEYGVNAFLTKSCGAEEIRDAIRACLRDEKFLCNKIIEFLLERNMGKGEDACKPSSLSNRELEIVKLIAQGFSGNEIAEQLFLSIHTIYTHRKNIMRKLGLKSASELVVFAMKNGIIKS